MTMSQMNANMLTPFLTQHGSGLTWSALEACSWLHCSVGRQLLNALLIPNNPPGLYHHPGPMQAFEPRCLSQWAHLACIYTALTKLDRVIECMSVVGKSRRSGATQTGQRCMQPG